MTPREELLALHDKLCSDAKGLMIRKNQDYSTATDPLKNFRKRGLLGMLVRLEDKMARLDTFIETGVLAVSEEPVDDVLVDIINYAVLMRYWIEQERQELRRVPPFVYSICTHQLAASPGGYLLCGNQLPCQDHTTK